MDNTHELVDHDITLHLRNGDKIRGILKKERNGVLTLEAGIYVIFVESKELVAVIKHGRERGVE